MRGSYDRHRICSGLIAAMALLLLSGCFRTSESNIDAFKMRHGLNFERCGIIEYATDTHPDYASSLECARDLYEQCTPMDVRETVYHVDHFDNDTEYTYLSYADDSDNCRVTLFIHYYRGDGSYDLTQQDCARLELPADETPLGAGQEISVVDCGEEQMVDSCRKAMAGLPGC